MEGIQTWAGLWGGGGGYGKLRLQEFLDSQNINVSKAAFTPH